MKISTKFEVGDRVQHKYWINKEELGITFYINEIKTVTCYVGTQVIYYCRPIITHLRKKYDEKDYKLLNQEVSGKDIHQFTEPELEKVK